MYCKNCSMKLDEGVLFCPNCGSRVVEETAGFEEDRTVLLKEEIREEGNGNGGAEDAVSQEEKPQDNGLQEEKPQDSGSQGAIPQDGILQETDSHKETAPETVEAVEISPTGVVAANEAIVVPQNNFEQKKYCPNCGTANNINDLFCQECGMFFGNPADKMGPGNPENPQKKKKTGKIVVPIIAIAAVLVLCILFLPKLLGGVGSKSGEKDYFLYIKDNELFLSKPSKYEPVSIDEKCYADKDDISSYAWSVYSYSNSISASPDHKYLYYPVSYDTNTYTYDLYRKNIDSKKAEEEKIDSNVVFYKIIDNNRIIYIKDNDDRKLYVYNQGNSEKVASDVASVNVSADGKNLVWRTNDGEQRLYAQDLDLKQDKVKLDSDVQWYRCSDDLNTIVYEKEDNLYLMKNRSDKEKIASDIEGYAYVYGINDNLQIYYMKEGDDAGLSMYDLIEDDYLDKDQKMTEPRIEDYQTRTYVNDFFGTREKVETDDAYYDAVEEYEWKQSRDYAREELKEESMGETTVEIYYYSAKTGESNKVIETLVVDGDALETEKTAMMYFWNFNVDKLETQEKPKLSKLMELSSEYDVMQKIMEAMYGCVEICYIKDGKLFEIPDIDWEEMDIDALSDIDVIAVEETHTLYAGFEYSTSESYYIEVYSYDYNGKDAALELISDEIDNIIDCNAKGIYYLNADDELYCNNTKIDSDVFYNSINVQEDGTVLYLTDIDKNNQEGTLKVYQNGKSTKLADDAAINQYGLFDGDKIAFLVDYNFNKARGDLKVYNGKEMINVDTDVQHVLFY